MKASYAWLQTYFDDPLPKPDELAALLTEHVFEVEEVIPAGDDIVFDFKILPDRAHYLLSHRGLAREIGVITGIAFRDKNVDEIAASTGVRAAEVRIDDERCRRYMARRIERVYAGESPAWMRERLAAVGQKAINALVDAGNYVMLDVGQPLHVFDADKVIGTIVARAAKDGEAIELLTGETVALTPRDLVIADDEGPLAIAGTKGGSRAGVTADTTNIVIEAANFDPSAVRLTSTRLNLRNDSSKRFENELTPELTTEAMRRISALIRAVSPEATASDIVDLYPRRQDDIEIAVTAEHVSSLLGVRVSGAEITEVLERMGCSVARDGETITFIPPADRFDLRIPEDVADEIGRIRGYNNAFPAVLPPELEQPQVQDPRFWYAELAKNAFVKRGYSEVMLYSFGPQGAHEIAKPLAGDKAWLRTELTRQIEDRLAFNRKNADLLGLDEIRIFEIGQVFEADREVAKLAGGLTLTKKRKGISALDIVKEDVRAVLEETGLDLAPTFSGDALTATFEAAFEPLPGAREFAELSFTHLEDRGYRKIVPYPFITRDIAVFVPQGVASADVLALINAHAGPLCVASRMFDEFSKDGRTSYAFRIVFQSPERTLEDREVNEVMRGVESAIAAQNWEVR